jgi:hypothetical protein
VRRFQLYRPNPPAEYREKGIAAAPNEVQLEGVVFGDGTVSVRWCTAFKSFSNWDSWETFEHVHGHPEYGTVVRWLDEPTQD